MDIKIDISKTGINTEEISALKPRINEEYEKICSENAEAAGWHRLAIGYDEKGLDELFYAAEEIKKKCSVLIVVGIGGSYMGTRAAAEVLGAAGTEGLALNRDGSRAAWADKGVRLVYAGNDLSTAHHVEVMREIIFEDVCLCVVSKSGETAESKIGFNVMKGAMIAKYGMDEANKRIYVVTDKESGALREETEREGYTSFEIPRDVGGRYSVLTPAGLLPLAVTGVDIRTMLEGARDAAKECAKAVASGNSVSESETSAGFFDYAAARYLLGQKKNIEIFEHFEPQLKYFTEWLKQLFGESEGKDGKGIFPASLMMSTDLHSMGQFLQEGNQIFFETVLNVVNPMSNITIPLTAGIFGGKKMHEVNAAAQRGMIKAHREAGVPIIKADITDLSPYCIGQLIYFFEINCAVYCGLLGVNAFNQPGVERYKEEMIKELGIEQGK